MDAGRQGIERVRLQLLGPFELFVDGSLVDVPRSRVRDLLTILVMRSPDIVSHDSLIEDLWGDECPKNPRAALRVVLSRARSVLGDASEALTTAPTGIRLHASSDVEEFFAADVDASDSAVFVNALALWRGAPHASLLPTTDMSAHAHRLEDRRVRLTMRLAEVLLVEGRAESAVDLLSEETRSNPAHEGLVRLHAVALVGSGRKADALRLLEETRTTLRSSLGVDPTPAFDAVERSILQDAVDLVEAARPTIEDDRAFVGRSRELELLLNAGARRVLLVGEAGIGKSRLLSEVQHRLQAGNGLVLRATCPNAPTRAMQTLAELVAALPPASAAVAPETAIALRRIDPLLAADPGDVVTAPIRREGFISLLAEHISDRVAGHETTIIIDDVHWIDRTSAEVVQALLLSAGTRIILATRPNPEGVGRSFGGDDVLELELRGLTEEQTKNLVVEALGERPATTLAASIHEQSGGNPFFAQLLISLAAEGALRPADDLPTTALIAVQSRIDRLSGPARQTLLAASVLGPDIDVNLLALIRPSMERDLTEAIDERLVERVGESRARFAHSLVAQGAYELLSEGQRIDLHDQFAAALQHESERAIEFARHAAGAEEHDPHRCAEAHVAAATAHLQSLSDAEAIEEARRAGRAVDRWQIRDAELTSRIGLVKGRALRWTDGEASSRALIDAATAARSNGSTRLLIEITLALCERGRNTVAGGVDGVAAAAVDELLARNDLTDAERARLLAGSSLLFAVSTADDEVRRRFADAVELARRTDDEQLEAEILLEIDFGLSHPFDFDQRVAATDRLVEIAGDDPDLRWEAAWLRFGTAVRIGDGDGAIDAYQRMRAGIEHVVQRPRHFGMAIADAVLAQIGGAPDEAEAWASVVLEEGLRRYPESWAMNAYGALVLGIRRTTGRVGELLPTFQSILENNPTYPTWGVCVAYAALEAGDDERAAQTFDALTGNRFGSLVRDGSWTSAIGVLAELAAQLDRGDDAATLSDLLAPFASQMLWSGVSPYGPAAESLAIAAEAFGGQAAAEAHREVAADLRRRLKPLGELRRRPPTTS